MSNAAWVDMADVNESNDGKFDFCQMTTSLSSTSFPLFAFSQSPSQNIPRSLRKGRDILESLKLLCDACASTEYWIEIESTINLCPRGLSSKSVGGGCAPSELDSTIKLNVDAVFQLKRPLCSFADSWEALHILFELKQPAECRSRAADKLVVLAERKPRPADKFDGLAEHKSRVADKSVFADGSRAADKIELAEGSRASGKVFWKLSVSANGCSAKDSGSDFLLWHSPQV